VWFFHGERDSLFPVTGVRRFVATLRAAGDTVKYTEYPGEGHGLAWLVVREKGIVPWLFGFAKKPGPL
jgi:dipeptidyl aminopeptidase/acylaminoacyl peptidase